MSQNGQNMLPGMAAAATENPKTKKGPKAPKKPKPPKDPSKTKNPGSAIGEAIGATMENAVHRLLGEVVKDSGFEFFNESLHKGKKKLYLYSDLGVAYTIDGIISDSDGLPVVIFESKYIRYKKHNRDKASWISNTYLSVKDSYSSIIASIAILAGRWSKSSVRMMRDLGIDVLIVPFERIVEVLAKDEFGNINFEWDEDDKIKPLEAWIKYFNLSQESKDRIGEILIDKKREKIKKLVEEKLESYKTRGEKVSETYVLATRTNHGDYLEIREFSSIDDLQNSLNENRSAIDEASKKIIDDYKYREMKYVPEKIEYVDDDEDDDDIAHDENEVGEAPESSVEEEEGVDADPHDYARDEDDIR